MAALYENLLGDDYGRLAPLLQRFHREPGLLWQGEATVRHSPHGLLRTLLRLSPMPAAGLQACTVSLEAVGEGERWRRRFDERPMVSRQSLRQGRLQERVGPVRTQLRSEVVDGALHQHAERSYFLGLPLPRFLSMQIDAREWQDGERFRFDVAIRWGGLDLLGYIGWLQPVEGV